MSKALVVLVLAGCANVTSAKRIGPDTWQIESHHGSDQQTSAGLITQAMATCPEHYRVVQQQWDGSSIIIQCTEAQ
jgi:hypothetical protein